MLEPPYFVSAFCGTCLSVSTGIEGLLLTTIRNSDNKYIFGRIARVCQVRVNPPRVSRIMGMDEVRRSSRNKRFLMYECEIIIRHRLDITWARGCVMLPHLATCFFVLTHFSYGKARRPKITGFHQIYKLPNHEELTEWNGKREVVWGLFPCAQR